MTLPEAIAAPRASQRNSSTTRRRAGLHRASTAPRCTAARPERSTRRPRSAPRRGSSCSRERDARGRRRAGTARRRRGRGRLHRPSEGEVEAEAGARQEAREEPRQDQAEAGPDPAAARAARTARRPALHYARRGAIAQLGERLDRTQEVAGSSPASSTSERPANAGLLFVDGERAAHVGEGRLSCRQNRLGCPLEPGEGACDLGLRVEEVSFDPVSVHGRGAVADAELEVLGEPVES